MGFSYRKRVRTGKSSWLNISTRGVSASARKGRLTVNSRGRATFRILPGLSYRGGCVMALLVPLAGVIIGAAVAVR